MQVLGVGSLANMPIPEEDRSFKIIEICAQFFWVILQIAKQTHRETKTYFLHIEYYKKRPQYLMLQFFKVGIV